MNLEFQENISFGFSYIAFLFFIIIIPGAIFRQTE